MLERDPTHEGALKAVARIAESREDWDRTAGALAKLVDLANGAGGVPWALKLAEAREKTRRRDRRGGGPPAGSEARADERGSAQHAPAALGASREVGGARGAPRR